MDTFGKFATGAQTANPRVPNKWLDILRVDTLLAKGGWRYDGLGGHVHVRLDFRVSVCRGIEDDGRVWLTIECTGQPGGDLQLADCIAAARCLIPAGAPIRFGMPSTDDAVIQWCLEAGGTTNCALALEEVLTVAAAIALRNVASEHARETWQNQYESQVGMPLLTPAATAVIDAPEGWVGQQWDFKHVRTWNRVAVEKAFERSAPKVKWRLVTLRTVAPLVEAIYVTADAFIGRGRRARILPPSQPVHARLTLAYRLDGHDPCEEGCEMDPGAIEKYIASHPELARMEAWTPHETLCWKDGERKCSTMHSDWHPLQYDGFRMFRNEYAGLLGWANQYTAENVRTVHLNLCSGRWTLARVMEGGTSFIRRGTSVRVKVGMVEKHTCVEFRHTLIGPPLEGSVPLEEAAMERALLPWRKLLADARVPPRPGAPAARASS